MMLSYSTLSTASVTTETRREQSVLAQYLFDGATLKAAEDAGSGAITVPNVVNESVGAYTVAISISDNGSSLAHSLAQSSAISLHGRMYSDSRITALKTPLSPFAYSLAVNSSVNLGSSNVTGSSGSNGDVYCNGNLDTGSGSAINGDAEATGSINVGSHSTITGQATSSANTIPFPTVTSSNYLSLGSLLGSLLGGHTFSPSYEVEYKNGAILPVSMQGTFSGKGIIFIVGNLNITNDTSYSSSTDDVLIIVTGNVTVESGASNIVGYFYCGGTFTCSSHLTVTRGAIAANAFNAASSLTINYDPTIWTTIGEANRMKMPGFWP
jgi:hypothetical protein